LGNFVLQISGKFQRKVSNSILLFVQTDTSPCISLRPVPLERPKKNFNIKVAHVKRIDEQHSSEFTPNLTGNHAIISCTGCTLKIEAMKRSKVSNHAIVAHGTTPEIQ